MFPFTLGLTPFLTLCEGDLGVCMRAMRPVTAAAVAFCFFIVQSASAAGSFNPETVKDQVSQFGPGAKVKLKLTSGQIVSGSISEIEEDDFLLLTKRSQTPAVVPYGDVRQLKLASRRYTAHDSPNAAAARSVVVALGVGHHIVVNPIGAKAIHGNIQSIEADAFTVVPDDATAPVRVAYTDVRHVEKNLSLGATIVLVVLIGAALIVGLTVAATR